MSQTDTRLQRRIDSIIGHLEYLRHDLPNARAILEQAHRHLDGYAAGTDAPKVSGGEPVSSVEGTVCGNSNTDLDEARSRIDADLRSLDDELDAARKVVKNLRDDCNRHIRRHKGTKLEDENKHLRCKGTGDPDGATCTNIASHHRSDGRCVECGPAYDKAVLANKAKRERKRYLRVHGQDVEIEEMDS